MNGWTRHGGCASNFNVATAVTPWELFGPGIYCADDWKLQYGHGAYAVGIGTTVRHDPFFWKLQCGHGAQAVEAPGSSRLLARPDNFNVATTGEAVEARGYEIYHPTAFGLQCGHGAEAVGTSRTQPTPCAARGFNGATAPQCRGFRPPCHTRRHEHCFFNVATAVTPWKRNARTSTRRKRSSFNVATALRPWS